MSLKADEIRALLAEYKNSPELLPQAYARLEELALAREGLESAAQVVVDLAVENPPDGELGEAIANLADQLS